MALPKQELYVLHLMATLAQQLSLSTVPPMPVTKQILTLSMTAIYPCLANSKNKILIIGVDIKDENDKFRLYNPSKKWRISNRFFT